MALRLAREQGFTIIELLVVMAISLFVLAASSKIMISMTTDFKQQTRIAQKSLESGFGLDVLRHDILMAGFGLPTGIKNTAGGLVKYDKTDWSVFSASYKELNADQLPGYEYNDAKSPYFKPPKLVAVGTPAAPYSAASNGSDYLVLRGASLATDQKAGKFHVFSHNPVGPDGTKSQWDTGYAGLTGDPWRNPALTPKTKVIVLNTKDEDNFGLVNTTTFWTTYDATSNFRPVDEQSLAIIYGIASDLGKTTSQLVAPFNRVDYYLSDEKVPSRCAPGSAVLMRAEMMHNNDEKGDLGNKVKIMDCVLYMQVRLGLDTDNDGTPDDFSRFTFDKSAKKIRDELREVAVYLLTHEGQFDRNFEYNDDNAGHIQVGDHSFAVSANVGTNWKNYRWRVLKLSESPIGGGI